MNCAKEMTSNYTCSPGFKPRTHKHTLHHVQEHLCVYAVTDPGRSADTEGKLDLKETTLILPETRQLCLKGIYVH